MNKNIKNSLLVGGLLLLPLTVLAQNIGIKNPIEIDTIGDLVTSIVRAVRYLILPFIVLAIMYSGWLYIAAQGNSKGLTKANNALKWTLIGSLIVLSAELISAIITNTFN
jgi:hypothetical protein